ncbi:MAG: adenylate kinase [Parachlamydiales bacterium]|nr:adenylate kinase [Parachlamydiales bacterium]
MKNMILFIAFAFLMILAITTYRGSKNKNELVVIMMGPPGAGKGTHATELSKKLDIPHISTGDLFRENIKNETALGLKAKQLIEKGELVPDEIVIDMLFNYIEKNGFKKGYILDGFPRTLSQARVLDEKLSKKAKKIAINLNIDDSKLVDRITGRLMCSSCGSPFHKTFMRPKVEGKCDKCNGDLYQRKDDTAEVVVNRLNAYHHDTEPLIGYYKNENALFDIDSNQSKEAVFENLLETVQKAK